MKAGVFAAARPALALLMGAAPRAGGLLRARPAGGCGLRCLSSGRDSTPAVDGTVTRKMFFQRTPVGMQGFQAWREDDPEFLRPLPPPKEKPYSWVKGKNRHRAASALLRELNVEAMIAREKQVDIPFFRAGDALEVHFANSTESERTMRVRGMVLGRRNRHFGSTFRLLCMIGKYPAEFSIPMYSPLLRSVRLIQESYLHKGRKRTRRAKLYYVRDRPQAVYTITNGAMRLMRIREAETRGPRRQERLRILGELFDNDPEEVGVDPANDVPEDDEGADDK